MSGQSCCKNKLFTFSKRNYLEDYGNIESKKIDMTLSGTYLYKYPFNHIKKYRLDKYPNHSESQLLIENIKKKFSLYDKNYEIILGPGSNGLIQNICKILLNENDVKEMENHNISMVPIIDQNGDLHFRIACQTHKINMLFIKELYKIDNIRKYILS